MRRAALTSLGDDAVLARPILNERGGVLLTAGTRLTERYVRHLLDRGTRRVTIDDPETEDIEIPDLISDALRATATSTVYRVYEAIETAVVGLKGRRADEIRAAIRSGDFKSRAGHLVPTEAVIAVVDEIMSEVMDVSLLTGMAAIKSYDNYTFAHSVEMATAAIVVGRRLRLDRGSLRRLARACLLHDIGKVFVPDAILNKRGALTPEEQSVMRTHAALGYELLQAIQPNDVLVNQVAYQHHERQDGHGYPRGLTGYNRIARPAFGNQRKIILIAEIAAVADVYDALASDRPYRAGLAPEAVLETMRAMGSTALNQEVLDVFCSAVPVFPIGMTVRMTNGRWIGHRGVVARIHRHALTRPVVRLLRNQRDEPIAPIELDLSREKGLRIVAVL
jgi:putative nucleotidyltransferase with HDIG domain